MVASLRSCPNQIRFGRLFPLSFPLCFFGRVKTTRPTKIGKAGKFFDPNKSSGVVERNKTRKSKKKRNHPATSDIQIFPRGGIIYRVNDWISRHISATSFRGRFQFSPLPRVHKVSSKRVAGPPIKVARKGWRSWYGQTRPSSWIWMRVGAGGRWRGRESRSPAVKWEGGKPTGLLVSQRVPLQRQMAFKVREKEREREWDSAPYYVSTSLPLARGSGCMVTPGGRDEKETKRSRRSP